MNDPSRGFDASRVSTIEPTIITGTFWHQGAVRRPLLTHATPATGEGRYHREGDPGAWYASSKERAAWAELFRHHASRHLSPFEVRRRVGRVSVRGLRVLDLTNQEIREALGLDESDLIGDDRSPCQRVARTAHGAGFEGILAPSAAMEDERTLVVFPEGMRRLREDHSRIQRPPRSMVRVLDQVRISGRARRRLLRLVTSHS